MGIDMVFSRCPVGTATELIIKKGWLQAVLETHDAQFRLLQSMAPVYHRAHYTQEEPLHVRDGGNIPPLWAQSQGDRSVLLGVSYQKELRGVFVRTDSEIRHIDDLRGKRLAIPIRPEAVVDFRYLTMLHGFEGVLAHVGISLEEVELTRIRCHNIIPQAVTGLDTLKRDSDFMTEDFQAVLEGRADAAFANSIKAVRHNRAGIFRNILSVVENKEIPNINNNSVLAITCTKLFAYAHPELVVAYLRELIKGGRWIKEHRNEFLECTASGVYGASAEEMGAAFENETLFQRVPELTEQGFAMLDRQKEFMLRWNMIPREKDFEVSAWADGSFLREAFSTIE
ncbi:ABC transporter substrate-binding protein [Enterocloster lavalensis]|nr:ABC transporter substrate-binding protein [Enterocloster lavalensis]